MQNAAAIELQSARMAGPKSEPIEGVNPPGGGEGRLVIAHCDSAPLCSQGRGYGR